MKAIVSRARKRISTRLVFTSLIKAVSSIGFLILNAVLIVFLGKEVAGKIVVGLTIVIGFASICKFGYEGVIVREISALGEHRFITESLFLAVTQLLKVLFGVCIAMTGLLFSAQQVLEINQLESIFFVFSVPLFVILGVISAYYKGLKQLNKAMMIEPGIIFFIASLAVALWGIIFEVAYSSAVQQIIIVLLLMLGIYIYMLRKDLRVERGDSFAAHDVSENLGFLGFDFANYMVVWFSNLVIFSLFGPAAVSDYSVAFRLCMAVNFILVVYNLLKAPDVARLLGENKIQVVVRNIRNDTNKMTISTMIVAIFLIASVGVCNRFEVFNFEIDLMLVVIIAVGYLINVFYGPLAMLLNMSGRSVLVTRVFLLSGAIFVSGAVMLGYVIGIYGVAVMFCVSQIIQNYRMNQVVKNSFGMSIR